MKKIVSFFAATALVATMMTTSSCTKTCDAGYEGSDCKTEARAKFENGAWSVSESKNGGSPYTYSSAITASSTDVSKVLISKVANGFFNSNVVASVTNSTTLTIASQTPDNDGYAVTSTSGSISGTTITLNYSITGLNGSGTTVTDNYSSTWTHQ